jgi:cell division protein FtsQ
MTKGKRPEIHTSRRADEPRGRTAGENRFTAGREAFFRRPPAEKGGVKGPLTLLIILVFLTGAVLLGWNYFTIRNVEIIGNKYLTWQEIYDLSGVRLDTNMFMLDPALVRKRLETNPLVKVQRVERVFPDTVVIEIAERSPRAAVELVGRYAVIGDDYIVLDVCSELPAGEYPLVTNIKLSEYNVGGEIASEEKEKLSILKLLLDSLYDTGAVKWIGEIDLKDTQNVAILSREGIYILVGEIKNLDQKFRLLDQIMPDIQKEGYTSGKVFLTKDSVNFIPDSSDENPDAAS